MRKDLGIHGIRKYWRWLDDEDKRQRDKI